MEKHQHPFDDFLKETLKGHQLVPREEARKAFLEEAATIRPARRSWLRWYYLPLLVVVLSGIVAFFSYFGREKETPGVAFQNETPVHKPINTASSDYHTSTLTQNEKSNSETVQDPEKQNFKTEKIVNNNKSAGISSSSTNSQSDAQKVPVVQATSAKAPADDEDSGPAPVVPTVAEPAVVVAPIVPSSSNPPQDKAEDLSVSEKPVEKDTLVNLPPATEPKKIEPDQASPELAFAGSAYYLPEWMFNTVEGGKFVNNFGLDFTFYRGRTSIRTGAGISVSEGITEKAVEYNEFLGTYNKLDSITFVYSETENSFQPNIFTSTEKVWDSLSLYDSTEIVKRYTYLQIPLILGFDFWQNNRLTVGVRIGTIMSVMLKSKQLTGAYEPGANQVIGISQLSPDRVSMNWQAVGGINGSLMLTRRLYLEIEPQAKYYYQSIYEKSGYEKKPWSVGLRVAMQFKF